MRRACDPMTLAQTMTIGFPLKGRTWIAGVRQLQPGFRVRSFAEGEAEVRRVARPVARASWSFDRTVTALREATDRTIGRICRRMEDSPAIGLSGGLDSRICLASLHAQEIPHTSLTFCSDPGDPDNMLAVSATGMLGEPHATVAIDSPLAMLLYRDFRIINEGESPGFGFFFLAAAAGRFAKGLLIGSEAIRDTPFGTVQPAKMKKVSDLVLPLLQVQMYRFPGPEAVKLLSARFGVTWNDILDEWHDSFAQIPGQPVVDMYLDHMLENRIQRRTRPRLDAARWFCQPVYPYMDNELYNTFRSIPLEHLAAERAHLSLLSCYRSGLEGLPNAARYQAGMPISREYEFRRIVQFARSFREKVLLPLDRGSERATGRRSMAGRYAGIMAGERGRMKDCGLFDAGALERLMTRAARGAFMTVDALHSLVSAVVVHDFLFGDGLSGPRSLRFIGATREIRFQAYEEAKREGGQT